MISLEQATQTLLEAVAEASRTRLISLEHAIGRVAAEDISAPIDMPPFDRSPLDGYALRAADIAGASRSGPVKLKVAAEIPAGSFWDCELPPGQIVRVMTGSMLPEGVDCVVMQEHTDDGEEEVEFYRPMKAGENICLRGEDIKNGTPILAKGTPVCYSHLGVLASVGLSRITVRDKVRAGLLSTGDELTLPGEPLEPGKIYNSNLFMLAGRMQQLGTEVTALYKARDNVDEVCEIIRREIDGTDVFFTTGGVSVGRRDIMHPVIERLGAEKLFWKVALKPGTPALAAIYHGKLLLCLSGNPFAALTDFELLGRPILAKLAGDTDFIHQRVKAVMADAFPKASKVRRFIRAVHKDGMVHLSPYSHSSGALLSLLGCNALIDVPAGSAGLEPGDAVELVML